MKKLMLSLAATMILTGTALASEWNFYGSARVQTFYTKVEDAFADSVKTLDTGLTTEAVIGATIKASDTLGGGFEYGSEDGVAAVRYLYGVWNFGPGTLLVGKEESPLAMGGSEQVYSNDAALAGWGELSSSKKAQLRLTLENFQLALRKPDATYNDGTGNVETDTEVKIPSVEARYEFPGDTHNLAFSAGFHRFKVGPAKDQSITSWVLGTGGDITVGPLVMGGNLFAGENVGNLIDADVNGGDTGKGYALYRSGRVTDNRAFGYRLYATWALNDTLSIHGGYGYMETELDNASEDDVKSYYLQLPVTLAPGVFVVPEVGVVDYVQDTAACKTTYLGAKWQVDF